MAGPGSCAPAGSCARLTADRASTGVNRAARQYRAMGIANEVALATRSHAISDITELYRPQSRLERTLQWGADKYMVANLLAPWTDWGKINASSIAGNEILRASKAVAEGKATKRQITQLAEGGIPDWLAGRIWNEFSSAGAGEVVNGVHLPNKIGRAHV